MMEFAAYTGMSPGELMAPEWREIDLERNRVHVRRRLPWEARHAEVGEGGTIALPPGTP